MGAACLMAEVPVLVFQWKQAVISIKIHKSLIQRMGIGFWGRLWVFGELNCHLTF